jgi:4-hydroxy-4-methyl-2-oxoglutarate aldolase
MDKISKQLEKCYTGVVFDVMREQGISNKVLPQELRPLIPGVTLCGPIFTVSGHVDETVDGHESLLQWTGFLSKAKRDHVVVCQPNDSRVSHMGELSSETFKYRGIRGYVVDGGIRDSEFILSIGFQIFHRYFTPKDIVGYWIPDGFDVPIIIGGVEIIPGDYLLGDRDGVVIIPGEHVEEITTLSTEAMQKESLVRKSIMEGDDPQEAYLKYGKF